MIKNSNPLERYSAKIEGDRIAVIRRSDGKSIAFAFEEVISGYNVMVQNSMSAQPLLDRLRREAIKAAKREPSYVWG